MAALHNKQYSCNCEQCSTSPAPTWTEAHRRACEARFVARMPRARRLDYFDRIERRRGLDGVIVLKYEIAKLPSPHKEGAR